MYAPRFCVEVIFLLYAPPFEREANLLTSPLSSHTTNLPPLRGEGRVGFHLLDC